MSNLNLNLNLNINNNLFFEGGGYNFAIRVGNGTTNQNQSEFLANCATFLAADFVELRVRTGMEFGGRDTSTPAGQERYALIGGSDKEVVDNLARIRSPRLFTSRNSLCSGVALANATIANVEYTFSGNSFTGTLDPTPSGKYGYLPGTRRATYADSLPPILGS
jgi:hypothetical protein